METHHEFQGRVSTEYPDYLRDESRRSGKADTISFPKNERELSRHLSIANSRKIPVTVQGARTGITCGAVPDGGHILNLSRMNKIIGMTKHPVEDAFIITVQPGVLLFELRSALDNQAFDTSGWSRESQDTLAEFTSGKKYFFTPDPTEASASLGGMVACNASGARSFYFGATRQYVESLRAVTIDGSVISLKRDGQKASKRQFTLNSDSGRTFSGSLPSYTMPKVKNASGFYAADNMDLIDLLIGSEGTLAVISEIGLKLIPQPPAIWGIMAFFPSEAAALSFVRAVRTTAPKPTALEFFDSGALTLLRRQKETNPAFAHIPAMDANHHTAIYIEYMGENEEFVEKATVAMSDIMLATGGDPNATWMASGEHQLSSLKQFRHAVPEAVNLLIDERRRKESGLTKLGTDLSVPDPQLEKIMDMYRTDLTDAGLEYVIFGHIGNNHVHVNITPSSMDDYQLGKKLYMKWARTVVAMGGSVSAEHGIGKLKTEMLTIMYGKAGIGEMKAVKRIFDPDNLLNPGNLFS